MVRHDLSMPSSAAHQDCSALPYRMDLAHGRSTVSPSSPLPPPYHRKFHTITTPKNLFATTFILHPPRGLLCPWPLDPALSPCCVHLSTSAAECHCLHAKHIPGPGKIAGGCKEGPGYPGDLGPWAPTPGMQLAVRICTVSRR